MDFALIAVADDFVQMFRHKLTSDEQRQAIGLLMRGVNTIRTGTTDQKRALGIYLQADGVSEIPSSMFSAYELTILDSSIWRLVVFYRVRQSPC